MSVLVSSLSSNDDVTLEYSLYHYYLWKERQTMIQEESIRKYKSAMSTTGHVKVDPEARTGDTPVNSTNDNENDANNDKVEPENDNKDDTTANTNTSNKKTLVSPSPFEKSCKYRLLWNYIGRLFPEIAAHFSVDEASRTIPEVYRRYNEYTKLEKELRDIKRFGTKRTSIDVDDQDDNNEVQDSSRKRARTDVVYPWRGQPRQERHTTNDIEERSQKRQETSSSITRVRSSGNTTTTTSNEAPTRKVAFEKYIEYNKTSGISKHQFFTEACKHFQAFKRRVDGKFAVSKQRYPLVFKWVSRIITQLKQNELRSNQIDTLLDIEFLSRKVRPIQTKNNDDDNISTSSSNYTRSDDEDDDNVGTKPAMIYDPRRMSLKETAWHANYEAAIRFYNKHGHFAVPRAQDRSLYNWLYFQCRKKQNGELPKEKIKKLEAVGFTWDVSRRKLIKNNNPNGEDDVEEFIVNFVRDDNDDDDYDEAINTGRRSKAKFDVERLKNMSPYEVVWYNQYQELVEFNEFYHHTRVTRTDNVTLHYWLDSQKRMFRKGRLPPDRTELLLALGVELDRVKDSKKKEQDNSDNDEDEEKAYL